MQGNDARDYCSCTELDPNRQELWFPHFGDTWWGEWLYSLHSTISRLVLGRDLGGGKIDASLELLTTPCVSFLEHCAKNQEPGLWSPPSHQHTTCPVCVLASALLLTLYWCHIRSLNAESWISYGIWKRRVMGNMPTKCQAHLMSSIPGHDCAKLYAKYWNQP